MRKLLVPLVIIFFMLATVNLRILASTTNIIPSAIEPRLTEANENSLIDYLGSMIEKYLMVCYENARSRGTPEQIAELSTQLHLLRSKFLPIYKQKLKAGVPLTKALGMFEISKDNSANTLPILDPARHNEFLDYIIGNIQDDLNQEAQPSGGQLSNDFAKKIKAGESLKSAVYFIPILRVPPRARHPLTHWLVDRPLTRCLVQNTPVPCQPFWGALRQKELLKT